MSLLLQQGPKGLDLDWLVQAAIVVMFFVLPALKALLEKQKRAAGKSGPVPRQPARRATTEEPSGRDLWRELLSGKGIEAPQKPLARAPAAPVRPRPMPRPVPGRSLEVEPRALERTPLEGAVPERIPLERAAPQRASLERAAPVRTPLEHVPASVDSAAAERVERRELQPYATDITTQSTLPPSSASVAAAAEVDPATLDDEVESRWGTGPQGAVQRPAQALIRSEVDWRRAVLVSELLSPPLSLRGSSAAWPGPPAALAG